MDHILIPDKFAGKVDAAFRVSGNSLEPIYFDGDYLLVEHTKEMAHGDLGVFLIGDTLHVRRFYDKDGVRKLIPLCVDIPEVPVDDSIVCLGRVLGGETKYRPQRCNTRGGE